MSLSYRHGQEFIGQVRPLIERRDTDTLIAHLARAWPHDRLTALLGCRHEDAAKTALVCLSLIGTMADCPAVAGILHHDDEAAASFAEFALWSIWFRAGDRQANVALNRAVQLISQNRYAAAAERLTKLIVRCPEFAEPYNQRATTRLLQDYYTQAIEDGRQVLQLNPYHFGAMVSLGHCYAAQGRFRPALHMYRAALHVHPRMQGIQELIQQICQCIPRQRISGKPRSSPPN